MSEAHQPSTGELQARAAEKIIQDAQRKAHQPNLDASKASMTPVPPQEYISIPPGELQARAAEKIIRDAQTKPKDNVINPELEVVLQKLELEEKEERRKRWEQVAVPELAKRLGLDPLTLTPQEHKKLVDYDPDTFNRAHRLGLNPLNLSAEEQKKLADYSPLTIQYAIGLGLNPHTLTPQERKDLTIYGEKIINRAKKLGLDPHTLTPQERKELGYWGRIQTDEERKKRAEIEAEYSVKLLTPEEWRKRLSQYLKQRQANPKHAQAAPLPELLKQFEPHLKERGLKSTLTELILALIPLPLETLAKTAKMQAKTAGHSQHEREK